MDKSTGPPTRPRSSQCTALVLILMLEEIWSSVVMGSEEHCWLCNYTYYRYQPTSRKGWTASSLLIGFNKVKLLVSISRRNTNSTRLSFPTLVNVKPQINTGLWSVSKPNLSVSIPIKGLIALQMHLIFEAKMKKKQKQNNNFGIDFCSHFEPWQVIPWMRVLCAVVTGPVGVWLTDGG